MYFGRLDPAPRAPLELPAHFKNNKDGSFTCKQHGNANCKSCCGFQILNLIFLDSSQLTPGDSWLEEANYQTSQGRQEGCF